MKVKYHTTQFEIVINLDEALGNQKRLQK